MNGGKLVLSVHEVQELLGLSRSSVYQGIQNGEIPSVRVGKRILIPRLSLERMLSGENHKTAGATNYTQPEKNQ